MSENLGIKQLTDADYVTGEDGVKSVTWLGMEKRRANLYLLQTQNRQKVKDFLNSLGYEILKITRGSDGWGNFQIDFFEVKDRRNNEILQLSGSDDNSALYKVYKSGGRGLWKAVPETTEWQTIKGC